MATVIARLSPADHGRAMTLDEYLEADVEEGFRYELARGVVEVTRVPDEWPHGLIVSYFYVAFAQYKLANPGVVYRIGGGSEFQFVLPTMISGRNPDVAVALCATPKDAQGRRPASLAIEVVSRGDEARERDYVTKRAEYLAYGLREYWIVDHDARRITVLIRDGDAWVERVFGDEQVAAGLVLPGFAVPLAEVWPMPEGSDGADS